MSAYLKLQFMDDLKAESDLRALRIPFEVKTFPFSKLDLRESHHNGARLGDPILRNLVDDYKTGMENGDVFPRLVVRRGPSGYVILSGNQRSKSIEELISEKRLPKSVTIDAYVVETDDKLLHEVVARSSNVGHGGRSEKEERLAHAIYAVTALGMRTKDAAKIFMVSTSTIGHHIRAEEQRDELAQAGVNLAAVPVSSIEPLARVPDEGAKVKLGHLIASHNPGGDRVKQAVAAVRKANDSSARARVVKQFEKELADEAHRMNPGKSDETAPHKVPHRPRRDRLIRQLTQLANYLDLGMQGQGFTSLSDLQIANKRDEMAVHDLWKRLQLRMRIVLGAKK